MRNSVVVLLEFGIGRELNEVVGVSPDVEMVEGYKSLLEGMEENANKRYEIVYADYSELPQVYKGRSEVLPL